MVTEGRWFTGDQAHTPLEPRAIVAHWEGERLTVYASSQAVDFLADDIAEHFDLRRESVRVIARHVGGGFGSKVGLEPYARLAIELAKRAGAPVRYVAERDEELEVGGYRPAQRIDMTIGASAEGGLRGMKAAAWGATGIAAGSTTSFLLRLQYPLAEKELSDWDVVSNMAACKAMRAPGGPAAFFALESAVDEIAHALGQDPIALRRRWDDSPFRAELWEWVEALPAWKERPRGPQQGRYRRGVGLAMASWFYIVEPGTQVKLRLADGELVAETGTQDIGNGGRTVIARAVEAVLGIAPRVVIGDSDLVHGPLCAGSRGTASLVPAAEDAARQMAAELERWAGRVRRVRNPEVGGGGVTHAKGSIAWAEVLAEAPRTEVVGRRRTNRGGWYLPWCSRGRPSAGSSGCRSPSPRSRLTRGSAASARPGRGTR